MPETQTMSPASLPRLRCARGPERQQLREAQAGLDLAVAIDLGDRRVDFRAAAEDAADADAPDVLVVVDRRDEHLERAFFGRRFGDVLSRSFRRAARDRSLSSSSERFAMPARPLV
jgi:hypothetical protein